MSTMPSHVGRIRAGKCRVCPAPCAAHLRGENPALDPDQACPRGDFGTYDVGGLSPEERRPCWNTDLTLPLPTISNVGPSVWQDGPVIWKEMALKARAAQLTPEYLKTVLCRLPNGTCQCRTHWKALLDAYSPPYGASARDQWIWVWARHNDVNRRLKKPELTIEEAERLYS